MAKGVVKTNVSDSTGLKIRDAMNTTSESDTGQKLYSGFVLFGTVLGGWLAFTYFYDRDNQKHVYPATRYAAIWNPLNPSEVYIQISNETDTGTPTPTPTPVPVELPEFEIVIGGSDYNIIDVLRPDANRVIIKIKPK